MKEKDITLFKLSKTGAILRFQVIAREIEDGAVLITRKGQLGGAEQEDIESMYPKNVGRANETTPWQQALIMHNSKFGKLRDKGYKDLGDPEELDVKSMRFRLELMEGTDANGNFLPMLAHKDTDKIRAGFIQPKFDGVRTILKKDLKGDLTLRSRRGKYFTHLDHILEQVPDGLPKGVELDGELYHHDRSLQQIVSMVKREQPANKEIGFRAYDIMGDEEYRNRKLMLSQIVDKSGPQIIPTLTYSIKTQEQAWKLAKKFKKAGFEGAIWRDPYGLYEHARSWGLIKLKYQHEEEFEIVGVEEATGRDAGTAIFICETEEGKEFNVRPMGTRDQRREYFDNFDEKYLWEMLTVRFEAWTDGGIPFHARGITIRNYE